MWPFSSKCKIDNVPYSTECNLYDFYISVTLTNLYLYSCEAGKIDVFVKLALANHIAHLSLI